MATTPVLISALGKPTAADLASYRTAILELQALMSVEAWTAWTPTWTSSGTAPAIGNGVYVARYLKQGLIARLNMKVTFGTTSTFGTGTYYFSPPAALSLSAVSAPLEWGQWVGYNVGVGFLGGASYVSAATTISGLAFPNSTSNAMGIVTSLVPWTWASAMVLYFSISVALTT